MKYFDVHTHTNSKELINEFDFIVEKTKEIDMGLNIVGTTIKDSYLALEQSRKKENFYCSIGIHPNEVENHNFIFDIKELEKIILENQDKVKCIGECGLDFHYGDFNKNIQEQFLRAQIELAIKYKLTLMIHVRDAYHELIDILDTYDNLKEINVIIHCFSANSEILKLFTKRNFFISIPGIITYKNAEELKDAIVEINLNYLLSETDAPYLSPNPYRGKKNYPHNIEFTNSHISHLLGIENSILNKILVNNAKKALNINEIND